MFSAHPSVQSRYFPLMSGADVAKLSAHGGAVVAAIGDAVEKVKEGRDEDFVEEIREVK